MEKLTIEHLAPYLPYRLKIGIDEKEATLLGINENLVLLSKYHYFTPNCSNIFIRPEMYHEIHLIKPLLIPLGELTSPMFDGGSLLTIISHEHFGFGKGYFSEPEFKVINENGYFGYQNKYQGLYFVREETNYGISTYFHSVQKDNAIWNPQKVSSQLEMFQFLFKYHFDVFGLIDAGLALNKINTPSHI